MGVCCWAARWAPLAGLGLGLSLPGSARALMPLMTGLNGLPKLALGPLFIICSGWPFLQGPDLGPDGLFYFCLSTPTPASRVWTLPWGRCACWRHPGTDPGKGVIWPACLPWLLIPVSAPVWACPCPAPLWGNIGLYPRGMGWPPLRGGDVFNAQRVLCCVLILVILIILLDGVVRLLEARSLRWR